MRDLNPSVVERVERRLDARLDAGPGAPLAVALSGGGDSLALALIAARWARRHGRPLLVLNVDHGLQSRSAEWTAACAATAERLGAGFRALAWRGPYPANGLPAAARRARHALLADAARSGGARVVLMGHTADDIAEAARMRAEGSTTPSPREWSPSPAWPEGRGVFLHRPMLGVGRGEIRLWLKDMGEAWIDDPANDDPRFARSRARHARLQGSREEDPAVAPGDSGTAALSARVRETPFGLALDRQTFREAGPEAARRVLGAACLAAGGGTRPPRTASLETLRRRLIGQDGVRASLAGAQVLAEDHDILWGRTAGEMTRSGAPDLILGAGETGVFDGRFEVEALWPVVVTRLAGRMNGLSARAGTGLAQVPPAFRGALPVVTSEAGSRLASGEESGVRLRALARGRLAAACGEIALEAGLSD
ncbi:MAG: tRNA lysidine(34) synthetase TilS [Pseudomonadota bacterium]